MRYRIEKVENIKLRNALLHYYDIVMNMNCYYVAEGMIVFGETRDEIYNKYWFIEDLGREMDRYDGGKDERGLWLWVSFTHHVCVENRYNFTRKENEKGND